MLDIPENSNLAHFHRHPINFSKKERRRVRRGKNPGQFAFKDGIYSAFSNGKAGFTLQLHETFLNLIAFIINP